MRILFAGLVGDTLPPPYGGIPKRALMLARIWKEKGNTIGLVFQYSHNAGDDLGAKSEYFFEYGTKPNKFQKLFFFIRYAGAHPIAYFGYLGKARQLYPKLNREVVLYSAYAIFLERITRRFKPDIIVAETALVKSVFAGFVARKCGIPFVLETYAEIHDRTMVKFLSAEKRKEFWNKVLELSDFVIAPSDYCAQGPREFLPDTKIKMVYATTLETHSFSELKITKNEARATLQIPENEFCVLAVGAFTHRKGHDHMIEAAARLKKQGIKIRILLCGAGDPAWLEALAAEHDMTGSVQFFRALSEEHLRMLFRAADLYCDASNTPRACLGIALTEAMASSLPSICYDAGGLPEVIEANVSGFLVPLNDVEALGGAMQRVYELSPEERAEIGDAALQRARTMFDIDHIASQLITIFNHVINEYGKQH